MNKLIYLVGGVLAVVLLFQVNIGKFGTGDIFKFLLDEGTIEDVEDIGLGGEEDNDSQKLLAEGYYSVDAINCDAKSYGSLDLMPKAAVMSPAEQFSSENAGYFKALSEVRGVSTFVIVGENHQWRGIDTIMGSNYGFEGEFGRIEVDMNLLADLELESNFYSFFEEDSIYSFVPLIAEYFPDANILAVSVKDFAEPEELESFAKKLDDNLGRDDFIIFSTKFGEGFDETVLRFQDELTRDVLENMDLKSTDQLSIDSKAVIRLMMNWADVSANQKLEIFDSGLRESASFFIANLFEGELNNSDRSLTVLAVGDLMLGRFVRTLMNSNGLDYVFENIKGYEGRFFEGADVVHGNLEGPIKGEGRSGGTSMVFAFNEDVAPLLKKYGFTMVSIANNHATDQGWDGRDTTISALEGAGVGWCGHPSEADFESVYYSKVGDKKVAFLCFHDVTYKLDDAAAKELISTVRPNVDYLVVSIHWGLEYKHSPNWGSQVEPGRAFIDAGADFVIGHHPHVVESFEVYNGKLIFYSLGNFIFDQYWSKATQEQLGIGIVLDDAGKDGYLETKVYLFPMKSEMSQPRLMTEAERAEWIERFIGYGEYDEEMKSEIRNGVIVVP